MVRTTGRNDSAVCSAVAGCNGPRANRFCRISGLPAVAGLIDRTWATGKPYRQPSDRTGNFTDSKRIESLTRLCCFVFDPGWTPKVSSAPFSGYPDGPGVKSVQIRQRQVFLLDARVFAHASMSVFTVLSSSCNAATAPSACTHEQAILSYVCSS